MPEFLPGSSAATAQSDSLTDRLYDVGFFLVELFAALEVTAVIVANARITESLGLREELSSAIINSYLYPLFAVMLVVLVLSRWISRVFDPLRFFLTGLAVFAAGNLTCFVSATASHFFIGRTIMAVGGALAFAGQLWTVSGYHRQRLAKPLVWGEAGAALGVVAGPIVGAMFCQFSAEGWRYFFLLNATLALLTALFAFSGLHGRLPQISHSFGSDPAHGDDLNGVRTVRTMTAWQVAVSILVVGSEYLFSDYLQAKAGRSPLFVGGMTVLASIGAICGSLWAARAENQTEARMTQLPSKTAIGLLCVVGALGICLWKGLFIMAGVPIFACGLFMGIANVSIYASIVHSSASERFLQRSMVYLMGMQIGNALGIQAVGLAELWHLGVLTTAGILAAIPAAITLALSFRGVREQRQF